MKESTGYADFTEGRMFNSRTSSGRIFNGRISSGRIFDGRIFDGNEVQGQAVQRGPHSLDLAVPDSRSTDASTEILDRRSTGHAGRALAGRKAAGPVEADLRNL